jgi:hypothetical protein
MATISWAGTLSSTKPDPLVKAAEVVEAGAAVAASAGAVVEDEAAAVAVAAGAEAGTVTAAIAEAGETAAGNRAVQLKNPNREPGRAPFWPPRFFIWDLFAARFARPHQDARMVTRNSYYGLVKS